MRFILRRALGKLRISRSRALSHRTTPTGTLVAICCLVCVFSSGCSSDSEASRPTPRPTPAGTSSNPLPTPTDYEHVCALEGSVCDCPRPGCSGSLPDELLRPLNLPQMQPGQLCTTTAGHAITTHDFGGFALGDGPIEPLFSGLFHKSSNDWYASKTLWFALPSYSGPVLVRAARIDGQGPVGFGEQPLIGQLIIPPGPTLNQGPDGYRQAPGGTFVQSRGCYAWQVDVLGASYLIVFAASW